MLIERPDPIIEDRVLGCKVQRVGIQPPVNVLWPNRNDAAVVPRCSDLGRRLIGDGRERHQVRLDRKSVV